MDAAKRSGPWDDTQIEHFLDTTRVPLRLALLRDDGWPWIVSLWFAREEGRLWCATAADSFLARRLERAPRCGFEVAPDAPPYSGVRGHADARLVPERGDEWLERLARRYLGDESSEFAQWLARQTRPETAICLEPHSLSTWDYRKRMSR